MLKYLESECAFQTERLNIIGYVNYVNDQSDEASLPGQVINIMSPKVTEALPSGWQNIDTTLDASNWVNRIVEKCSFFLVQLKDTDEVVGFIFLYESASRKLPIDVRFGYLLSENYWGKGIGSELVKGLLDWCNYSGSISSIAAGIEPDNIGSIKVLVKNGFFQMEPKNEDILFYVYNFDQH
jgi:ribosomal-protein-alanine N-acetyltransferase